MEALEALGVPYLVGGRNEAALQGLAGPGCLGVRLADAQAPGSAFEGVGCVLSAVGPFAKLGEAPLDAAIAAGAHWVDTTAEYDFVSKALERDEVAREAGVCVLPACGVEYLPMYVGAGLLGGGPVSTYIWLDDFLPTAGSVRSMFSLAGAGPTPIPCSLSLCGRKGSALPIPGIESLLIHPDSRTHLMLKAHEAWAFTLSWPLARFFRLARFADLVADRVTDPSEEIRSQARFSVVVQKGSRAVRIDGEDVYAETARYAAWVAHALRQRSPRDTGVLAAHEALGTDSLVEGLALKAEYFDL